MKSALSSSLCFALLSALGLAPAACGGATRSEPGNSSQHPSCTAPMKNAASGAVSCQEGYTYRERSPLCEPSTPDSAAPGTTLPRVSTFVDCTNDASVCNAFAYGYCGPVLQPGTMRGCASGCGSDADCESGGRCSCSANDGHGACLYDSCFSDAECDPGFHCAETAAGCGTTGFVCQTARDQCFGQADCPASQFCVFQNDIRQCGSGSVCGRPFLVMAKARTAAAVATDAWLFETPAPCLAGLSAAERAEKADLFTRMGQLEHASIAAFARFQLQLLSLGAPPELVEGCTQALADETLHARLCFSLASAFAGRSIGPGRLDIASSLEATSLRQVVSLVLDEGCFGEVGAALEALEAARRETDPVLVATYERIAADEQRHAELAFRFVRWALETNRAGVEDVLADAMLRSTANAAARAVTVPCLSALLASMPSNERPAAVTTHAPLLA